VSGKRIGLLGMGNIGQAIAAAPRGFDMQVLYTDRKPVRDYSGATAYPGP
jgi:hydroxypyruvate reductase